MTTESTHTRQPHASSAATAPGLKTTNPSPVAPTAAVPIPITTPATDAGIEVARARAQLATTLNFLEDKLNPRKRVRRIRQQHPVVFAVAATGVAAVGAAIVYAGVRALRNR